MPFIRQFQSSAPPATYMDIIDWLEKNRYTIYYNLAVIKLLDELFGNIQLTKEEQELLSSAMAASQTRPPQSADEKPQGPKLTDINWKRTKPLHFD
jgi:hypothetical protein